MLVTLAAGRVTIIVSPKNAKDFHSGGIRLGVSAAESEAPGQSFRLRASSLALALIFLFNASFTYPSLLFDERKNTQDITQLAQLVHVLFQAEGLNDRLARPYPGKFPE